MICDIGCEEDDAYAYCGISSQSDVPTYLVVNGGSDSELGVLIPHIFPINMGSRLELLRVSQPSNSYVMVLLCLTVLPDFTLPQTS